MKAYVMQAGNGSWEAQDSAGFITSAQTQAALFQMLRYEGYTHIVINGQEMKLAKEAA